jgi:hypothetical protein
MKKPAIPTRSTIRPSDLTFGLSNCRRCLWIFYWFKVQAPMVMPLVSTLADLQEKQFQGATLKEIDPSLGDGKIVKWGEFINSKKIIINGEETRWRFYGKYDVLGENSDGSLAIIDCKVSDNDRDSGAFYAPQLEAYAYSLENPAVGEGKKVSTMGLLVWSPKSADLTGFKVEQKYVPVERDTARFETLLADLINMLEGDMPDSGEKCETCRFISNREALDL